VNEIDQNLPEINDVVIHPSAFCPNHLFSLVSVPRDAGTGIQQFYKCPIRDCMAHRFPEK